MREVVLVVDFGGQYGQSTARKIRDMGVYSEVVPYKNVLKAIDEKKPIGMIFTGSSGSVYEKNAPEIDNEVFDKNIPILGLCYGMQLIAKALGGEVQKTDKKEFGRVIANKLKDSPLLSDINESTAVWMNHQYEVSKLPEGFVSLQKTTSCNIVAMENPKKKIYAVQYHPEVEHTDDGELLIKNFLEKICKASFDWKISNVLTEMIEDIKRKVGKKTVLLALSGGVDSSVLCALLEKAIGSQLTAVFVDTGLMRKNEGDEVERAFKGKALRFIRVNAEERYLEALKGVTDPEKKRKIIGELFIRVFESEADKIGKIDLLSQGTIYPDVIESGEGDAKVIKSHHNVGGLPDVMNFEGIIEPLRALFKDEVRAIGHELKLPNGIVNRQPFPGPGLAIRVMGEVTKDKLDILREADAIFREEVEKFEIFEKPSQYFAVLTDTKTVGITGDFRTYDYTLALRAVKTTDFMTADWTKLPYELLEKVSDRIVNEVKHINRIVYDITSKPPATIEWE